MTLYDEMFEAELLFTVERAWDCVCPMCGEEHVVIMRWIGRERSAKGQKFKPPMNCMACKDRLIDNSEICPIGRDLDRFLIEIP